jgi:hypothetical protein
MTLIPITHWKLREAKFFMCKLVQEERTNNLDREGFSNPERVPLGGAKCYVFSRKRTKCFIQSAVPTRLDEKPTAGRITIHGFYERSASGRSALLGVETQEDVTMVPLAHALAHDLNPLYLAYADTGAPGAISEIGQKAYYFEVNGNQEKAVDVCRRYLDLLVRLVTDFDHAFP